MREAGCLGRHDSNGRGGGRIRRRPPGSAADGADGTPTVHQWCSSAPGHGLLAAATSTGTRAHVTAFQPVFGGHRHATRWLADRPQHPRGYFCHSACFGPPAGASGACRQPASRRTSEQGGSLAAESRRTEQLTGPGGRSACTPTISSPLALLQASTSARRAHRVNASHLGPGPPCRGVGGNISG